ncbi:MAG: serine hydrolase domain-containing protein, partial [Aureliella sp.]
MNRTTFHSSTRWLGLGCLLWASCLGPVAQLAAQSPLHQRIERAMQGFVDAHEIAGAVTVVAGPDRVLDETAVGMQDIEAAKPMDGNAIFWIASMTKPVTGVAVMMMVEQGKLKLDDNVAQYLPEFKELKNAEGEPVAVTIKQLMTHSAGLSELRPQESASLKTLAELTKLVATKPVQFPAGSKWQYSQTGINTAARIVEVVSGQDFDTFLKQKVFQPLKMVDTAFYLTQAQAGRVAKSYRRTESGELEVAQVSVLYGKSPTSTDRVPLANGGLFSTAGDYTRFCQMLLSGGTLDGQTILKPESVRELTSVHSGDL